MDNRDPRESLALVELQVEFLKSEAVSLNKTIDRLRRRVAKLTPKPKAKTKKRKRDDHS
mgnify:FL=1